MLLNMVGAFVRNRPFGTEIAFAKGLREIGVKVNEVDDSRPDQVFRGIPDATIVFKNVQDYYLPILEKCRGPKIVYQPDDVAFPHIKDLMRRMRKYCDYAFMYDDRGVKFAEDLGYKKAERLLLVADPELYSPLPDTKKEIDVCFVGSLTGGSNHKSRAKMCQIVSGMGLNVRFGSDVYDIEKIVQLYNSSKVVLNHATDVGQQFGHGYGYQCRHFEAGFTGACVLSNTIDNMETGDPMYFYEFENEEDLVVQLRWILSEQKYEKMGKMFYDELMYSHQPVHRAQQIVRFIEGIS